MAERKVDYGIPEWLLEQYYDEKGPAAFGGETEAAPSPAVGGEVPDWLKQSYVDDPGKAIADDDEAETSRTWGEVGTDTARSFGAGSVAMAAAPDALKYMAHDYAPSTLVAKGAAFIADSLGLESIANLYRESHEESLASSRNQVLQSAEITEGLREGQSEQIKGQYADLQGRIESAEGFDKLGAAASGMFANPQLGLDLGAYMLPGSLVPGGVGAAGQRAASALAGQAAKAVAKKGGDKIGARLTNRLAGNQAKRESLSRLAGNGSAALAAGTVEIAPNAADVYESALALSEDKWLTNPEYRALLEQGVEPAKAKQQIADDLAQSNVFRNILVGAAANSFGPLATIERAFIGRNVEKAIAGPWKETLFGAAKGFAGEAVSEGLESAGYKASGNYALSQIDPEQTIGEGVLDEGALGMAAGGPIGGVFGGVKGFRDSYDPTVQDLLGEQIINREEGWSPNTPRDKEFAESEAFLRGVAEEATVDFDTMMQDAVENRDRPGRSPRQRVHEERLLHQWNDRKYRDDVGPEEIDNPEAVLGRYRAEYVNDMIREARTARNQAPESETVDGSDAPVESTTEVDNDEASTSAGQGDGTSDGRDAYGRKQEDDAVAEGEGVPKQAQRDQVRNQPESRDDLPDVSRTATRTGRRLEQNVRAVLNTATRETNGRVRGVATADALPRHLRDSVTSTDGAGDGSQVAAMYDPNTDRIYVIADRIDSVETARDLTLGHEALHAGLNDLYGGQASVRRAMEDLLPEINSREFATLAERTNMPSAAYAERGASPTILLEELAAHVAGQREANRRFPKIRRLVDATGRAMRRLQSRDDRDREWNGTSNLEADLRTLIDDADAAYRRANAKINDLDFDNLKRQDEYDLDFQEYERVRYALKPMTERDPYFSRLYDAVYKSGKSEAKADYWRSMLKKTGISEEEMTWTTTGDYLGYASFFEETITRDELLNYIWSNGINVTSVFARKRGTAGDGRDSVVDFDAWETTERDFTDAQREETIDDAVRTFHETGALPDLLNWSDRQVLRKWGIAFHNLDARIGDNDLMDAEDYQNDYYDLVKDTSNEALHDAWVNSKPTLIKELVKAHGDHPSVRVLMKGFEQTQLLPDLDETLTVGTGSFRATHPNVPLVFEYDGFKPNVIVLRNTQSGETREIETDYLSPIKTTIRNYLEGAADEFRLAATPSDSDDGTLTRFADIVLKFETMQLLSGSGTNRRDILLTLPENEQAFVDRNHYENVVNTVAFARLDDREFTLSDGSTISAVVLQEAQSDWHQKGSNQGYGDPTQNEQYQAIRDAAMKAQAEIPYIIDNLENQGLSTEADQLGNTVTSYLQEMFDVAARVLDGENGASEDIHTPAYALNRMLGDNASAIDTVRRLRDTVTALDEPMDDMPVADAPFKKARWVDLLAKRVIAEAVQTDKRFIAWPSGAVANAKSGGGIETIAPQIYDKALVKAVKSALDIEPIQIEHEDGPVWVAEITQEKVDTVRQYGQPLMALRPPVRATPQQLEEFRYMQGGVGDTIRGLKRTFVQRYDALQQLFRHAKREGWDVDTQNNAVEKESLLHGRAMHRIRELERNYFARIHEKIKALGIDVEAFDVFLTARHAAERNAFIRERMDDATLERPSGMSDQEAADFLQRIEDDGNTAAYEALAEDVYAMNQETLRMSEQGGLINDETLSEYDERFEFWVPLRGVAIDPETGAKPAVSAVLPTGGHWGSVGGREFKLMTGRFSRAYSPLATAMSDMVSKAVRVEHNAIGNAMLYFVQDNPDPRQWEVFTDEEPDTYMGVQAVKDEDGNPTGQYRRVEQAVNMLAERDTYFMTKYKGRTFYIKFKDPDLRRAVLRLSPEQLNMAQRAGLRFNRLLSMLHTSLNPDFTVPNLVRDSMTGFFRIAGEQSKRDGYVEGERLGTTVLGNVTYRLPATIRSIARAKRAKTPRAGNKMDQYAKEFIEGGGETGYYMNSTPEELYASMKSELRLKGGGGSVAETAYGHTARAVHALGEGVDLVNASVENAMRVSTYAAARERGVEKQKALALAKELTVDFNQRGEAGVTMNAMYLFFNAGIQGSVNLVRALTGRTRDGKMTVAQKAAAFMVASSFSYGLMMRELLGRDEDDEYYYDSFAPGDRERSLIIPKWLFGGDDKRDAVTIPLPYGYNVFWVLGDTMADMAMSGKKGAHRAYARMFSAVGGSFSPIGFSGSNEPFGWLMKNALPEVMQPFIELGYNENYFGETIYNEANPFASAEVPKSSDGRMQTPQFYHAMAKFVNATTGGDEHIVGALDIPPEQIKHLADWILGGAGKFAISKLYGETMDMINGEDWQIESAPILGRFNTTIRLYADRDRFYEQRNDIGQRINSMAQAMADGDDDKILYLYRKYGHTMDLADEVKTYSEDVKALREDIFELWNEETLPHGEKVRAVRDLEEELWTVLDEFNVVYNEALDARRDYQ